MMTYRCTGMADEKDSPHESDGVTNASRRRQRMRDAMDMNLDLHRHENEYGRGVEAVVP